MAEWYMSPKMVRNQLPVGTVLRGKRYHGFPASALPEEFNARLASAQRIDETAVRFFAGQMLEKMDKHGDAGKCGWQQSDFSEASLISTLEKSLERGDFVSVANYAMMMHIKRNVLTQR